MINLIGYTINEMGLTLQLLEPYTGKKFMSDLGNLVVIIVSAAGALMTLYAIYIAYLFFTASDASKRKAARERLVKTIASMLIIIGLASVLSVINVTFNKAEGNIDRIGGGSTNYTSAYTYAGIPTFVFQQANNSGQGGYFVATGSFSLSAANIMMNGVALGENGSTVRFQKCRIDAQQFNGADDANFDISNLGEARYTCSLKSDNQYAITIRGSKVEEDSYFVTAIITFTIGDDTKELSMNVDLILDTNSSKIQFQG